MFMMFNKGKFHVLANLQYKHAGNIVLYLLNYDETLFTKEFSWDENEFLEKAIKEKRFERIADAFGIEFLEGVLNYFLKIEDFETAKLVGITMDALLLDLNLVWEDQ